MDSREIDMKEKIFIEINGVRQGMFLHSEETSKPVLLFLHGGPGSPEIMINELHPSGLEKLFTVCWWEQRGSGLSFNKNLAKKEMTMDQMVLDTLQVVEYLKSRFSVEKIYIMGHSWGSLLGVLTILKAPELFHAYIGLGQLANQVESERLAYHFMLQEFKKSNNQKMVKQLLKFDLEKVENIGMPYLIVRSKSLEMLKIGIMRNGMSTMELAKSVLFFKGYTMREKINFIKGSKFSIECLWGNVLQRNLMKDALEFKVPMYVFQGKFDYQVSYQLAKEYMEKVKAPVKGFYTFEKSAHSPCFEEPEKMLEILRLDVLAGKSDLSD